MDRAFSPRFRWCRFPRALPWAGMDAGLRPSVNSGKLSQTLDVGRWTLDVGRWTLDVGCWMLDVGCFARRRRGQDIGNTSGSGHR